MDLFFVSLLSGGWTPCVASLCEAFGYTTAAAGPKYHSLRHTARPVNNHVCWRLEVVLKLISRMLPAPFSSP